MIGRENETIAQQLGHANIIKSLKWWGSNHTSLKDFLTENRTQFPLKEKKGLEQAQALLSSLEVACVDITEVSASFTKSAWLTAYSLKMRYCGCNANFSAQLRWLSSGQLAVIMFEIESLMRIVIDDGVGSAQPCDAETVSMQMLVTAIESCDSPGKLLSWIQRGLRLFHAEQGTGDILYTPMGYISVEVVRADDGGAEQLTYGGRKNFFPVHSSSATSMAAIAKLLDNDKIDTKRLRQVHEIIELRMLESEAPIAGERG